MSVERTKRIFMIVTMLLASNSGIRAQNQVECHLKADFVSNYIWRGQDLGHVSLQPELSAPFRLATCNWEAEVGFVPWKSSTYEVNSFSVTNLSLRATKAIHITKSFDLPLFGQVIANPASQHFYFVFGFTLQAI